MRRTDVKVNGKSGAGTPWYKPWGKGGVAWRYLLFLILLGLFCLLLGILRGCEHDSWSGRDDDIFDIPDYRETPAYNDPVTRDIIDSRDGDNPFDGNLANPVPQLPSPADNAIVEIPSERMVPNPENPYRRISDSQLDVILDEWDNEDTYNRFAQRFKEVFPGNDYFINFYNSLTGMIQITVPPEQIEYVHDNLNSLIPEIDFKVIYEEIFANSASASDHNDPAFSDNKQSWYFEPIQAYSAWEVTKGSADVVVAVIDNYIDVTHPELTGRVTNPYSVERQSKNVLPPTGASYSFDDPQALFHGTHVSATAVGALDNGEGTAGIAPECTLMPISIGSQITTMKLLDAILYAIRQGADVINLSLGNYYDDAVTQTSEREQLDAAANTGKYVEDVWDYVFKLADERNCTIVWAGGNQGIITGLDEFKRNGSTLRVSAVDRNLRRPEFSNYGKFDDRGVNYSDVSAPGVDIYNAGPGNQYGYSDGTSMAAPIVTGAVALIKSVNPSLSNSEIVEIISSTSKPLPEGDHAGGLLQIRDALDRASKGVANFDEIKNNKSKILGNWQTTERHDVSKDGRLTGVQAHMFLHFDTPERGTITYKEDRGHDYKAPFKSTIYDDRIEIEQTDYATSPGSDEYYERIKFIGRRGANGMLECSRGGDDVFYLIRKG